MDHVPLTERSWLGLGTAQGLGVSFKDLWDLRPTDKGSVVVFGKVVQAPRWTASFGVGTASAPPPVTAALHWANSLGLGEFDQVLVSWYETGADFIGPHADKETPIVALSLGGIRTLRIRDACTQKVVQDIELPCGTYVVMGGAFQHEFTHEITRTKRAGTYPRISLSFRQTTASAPTTTVTSTREGTPSATPQTPGW